jgi:acyl carrier protein
MTPARGEIESYVTTLLQQMARDWEYGAEVHAKTGLFSDLGFESLEAVVLGTAIQDHYDRPMPFAELLADVGQREVRDLTVGELVRFVETHLGAVSQEA